MKQLINILTLLLFTGLVQAQDCDMIYNGDFSEKLDEWTLYKMLGGYGRAKVQTDGSLRIEMERTGNKPWAVQFTQSNLIFEKGKEYKITIEAKADSARSIMLKTGQNDGPWNTFWTKSFGITTEYQSYSQNFIMNDPTDSSGRVEINVGDKMTPVNIKSIKVEAVACLSGSEPKKIIPRETIEMASEEFSNSGPTPKSVQKTGFINMSVSGYVRSFNVYRHLNESYATAPYAPKTFIVNGVGADNPPTNGFATGYREPLMMLEFMGKPTGNTFFKFDFILDNQLIGDLDDTTNKRIQTYRYVNMEGGVSTDVGNFTAKIGGVSFFNMSQLTLGRYQFRDDMFERYPWEWSTQSFKRYTSFYGDQNLTRDNRFGSAAIQGIIVEGEDLPYGFSGKLVFGKTNGSNNGFQSFLTNNYKYISAGQIAKGIGRHSVSANYYQQKGFITNAVAKNDVGQQEMEQVVTTEISLNFKKAVKITSELGVGTFTNTFVTTKTWSPALVTKFKFDPKLTKVPLNLEIYHIGENFLNPNSVAVNTINGGVEFGQTEQYNTWIQKAPVTEIGQLTNNRSGINLDFSKRIGDLNIGFGLAASQEIKNIFNTISYQHRLAALERSRFIFYQNQIGPYGRIMNQWRRSWDNIAISDTNNVNYKKGFNTMDLSLKYMTRLFKREVIFTNYINYNSIQKGFSPFTKFDNSAFLRLFYEEFQVFYNVSSKTTLVGQVAFERAVANSDTESSIDGKNVDQIGKSFGIGIDYDFAERAGLYIRQKWYDHKDRNFVLDKFKGFESTIELKVFF